MGKSAFAHKGGMHVSGVSRVTASYEHIDPELVGNERRVLVSELSGRSNIVAMAGRHNIHDDPKLMDKILARVVSLENAGYQFEAADGSFDLLVRRCAGHVPAALRAAELPRQRGDQRRRRDPHRGHGQDPRRRARSATRWPRATARSTPWTPPCARP